MSSPETNEGGETLAGALSDVPRRRKRTAAPVRDAGAVRAVARRPSPCVHWTKPVVWRVAGPGSVVRCSRPPSRLVTDTLNNIRLFLASPGGVEDERAAVRRVAEALNTALRRRGWQIEVLGWEDRGPQRSLTGEIRLRPHTSDSTRRLGPPRTAASNRCPARPRRAPTLRFPVGQTRAASSR